MWCVGGGLVDGWPVGPESKRYRSTDSALRRVDAVLEYHTGHDLGGEGPAGSRAAVLERYWSIFDADDSRWWLK